MYEQTSVTLLTLDIYSVLLVTGLIVGAQRRKTLQHAAEIPAVEGSFSGTN